MCTVQCSTVPYSTAQCSAAQRRAGQCSALQCSAAQCSAVQCSTAKCRAGQCSAVQRRAGQGSAAQRSAAHHSRPDCEFDLIVIWSGLLHSFTCPSVHDFGFYVQTVPHLWLFVAIKTPELFHGILKFLLLTDILWCHAELLNVARACSQMCSMCEACIAPPFSGLHWSWFDVSGQTLYDLRNWRHR